ncbi:hypothetical protein E4U41_005889 [Claviceps citrina]|nr:hypothetical protein E4U41_005889 [Claviceps citrina]
MNVQYNSALRQSKSLRRDLDALNAKPAPSAGEIGNASASLSSFAKTLDEYGRLARREIVPRKQDEALERVKRFREDLSDFRSQLDRLRHAREEAQHQSNRAELLGRRPYNATPENPYADTAARGGSSHSQNPLFEGAAATAAAAARWSEPRAGLGGPLSMGSADEVREGHALREQEFFANTHSALDDYIARGQAVLGDLGQQREMLKNTQKRLYSVGNTLGISGDTIRMVERRARQDKWLFVGGVVVFFAFCWLVLHYLR